MAHPSLFTRPFVLAALGTLMLSLSAFLFVHLPGFLHQLGAGEAEIGRIMAAQAVGAVLAWPLLGRAMDAKGRRVIILGGCGLFLVVIVLYLFVQTLGPFVYAVRLLDGVAHTMWYTALFTYGADLVPPQRRTQGLAIFGTAGLITIGLGAFFGDVILTYADYHELFFGALVFAIFGSLLCLPLPEVRLHHDDPPLPASGMFAAAMQRNLIPVWCAAISFFVSLQALFAFLKTFVATTGIGTVSAFAVAYSTVAVLLRLLFGWIPDRLGTRRMLGIAMSGYVLGFIVLCFATAPAHVLIAGLLCGAGHGYTYPVLFSLVIERAKTRERGAAMSFYTAIDWTGLLIGGPLIGYLIERAGYGRSFLTLALLVVVGVALFYGLDSERSAKISARRS